MNPLQTLLYWKLFWAKLILSTGAIVSMAIGTALAGVVDWQSLSPFQKFDVANGVIGIICLNIISMLDRTYASLADNGKTLGAGATKQDLTATTQTVTTISATEQTKTP